MKPKKICLVVNSRSPQSLRLTAYLTKKGYEVNYINIHEKEFGGPGVLGKVKAFFNLKKVIKETKPDIVHGHGINWAGILVSYSGFRPIVVTTRGSDIWEIGRMIWPEQYLIKQSLKIANLVTGSSEALHNQALKLGMPPEKFRLVFWGIEPDLFKKKNVDSLRQKLELPKETKIIFCPRSIKAKYNIDVVLEAVSLLKFDYKLLFTDLNIDPGYWAKMQPIIEKHQLKDKIMVLPKTDSAGMAELDNLADVIVSIAQFDGLPVSFLEAMACEKKIVVANDVFAKEWHRGNNFWLVPLRDVAATTEAIKKALAMPEEKFKPLGEQNRAAVLEKADVSKGFEAMEKVYAELVK